MKESRVVGKGKERMEGEVGKEVIQRKKSWSDQEVVKWNGGCKEQGN